MKIYRCTLKVTEEFLSKGLNDELYQSIFQLNFDAIFNLGNLSYSMGLFLQAKNCNELNLSISQNLLQTYPENVAYQSYVGRTLNNPSALLKNIGRIEEAIKGTKKHLKFIQNPCNTGL